MIKELRNNVNEKACEKDNLEKELENVNKENSNLSKKLKIF